MEKPIKINSLDTPGAERRVKIIEALAGVDLTTAHFTWGAPDWNDPRYSVWVTVSDQFPTGWQVWFADTQGEVLAVRREMEVLAEAARKLVS